MKFKVIRQSLILCTVISLAGCASLPNVNVHDIQNRRVAYASGGEGIPVIVLAAKNARILRKATSFRSCKTPWFSGDIMTPFCHYKC